MPAAWAATTSSYGAKRRPCRKSTGNACTGWGETHPYRRPDGTLVEAVLEGVRPSGELILRHADGTRHAYLFREIEFVIAGKS